MKRGFRRVTVTLPKLVADHLRNRAKREKKTMGDVIVEYALIWVPR